jgi:hypothetical protein
MEKSAKIAWFTICALLQATILFSQTDTTLRKADSVVVKKDSVPQRHRVAIFTPLYLDSAFDAAGNYRYDKQFPRYINPGLEFWEGAQLAIDSLKEEGIEVDIHVYDTRGAKKKFESLLASEELRKMNLFIGHVSVNEAAQLARLANTIGIPFINANLPNDVGVTNNPNFVLLNSTLMTHCAGIYKFLQKNFALSNIIVFRKKGVQEDRLQQYFKEVEKNTASVPLKLKYVTLNNDFTPDQLAAYLDSNKTNVCLAGSLDLNFAQALCQQLSGLSRTYASTVFGMPTWESIDFEKSLYRGIEIYYSTPFYVDPAHKLASGIYSDYKHDFFVNPTENVFRGYETVYHFTHLLNTHNDNLGSSLGDKKHMLFTELDIQPILNKSTQTLDYFENKKLYIVRKVDGLVKAVY